MSNQMTVPADVFETIQHKRVRLDHLLGVYSVGSGDWPWMEEYDNLIDQPDTRKLLDRIRAEGIREPILLGTDGRIWDGHHRIVIAMHLGIDRVPVEFAGEPGALAVHDAEIRAEAWDECAARVVAWNRATGVLMPTDNPYRGAA